MSTTEPSSHLSWAVFRPRFQLALVCALALLAAGCTSGKEETTKTTAIDQASAEVPNIATTTIYVVRHAEKQTEGDDPGLTPAGALRAAALAEDLAELTFTGVISSEYLRAKETCRPTAEQQDLVMAEVPALDPKETAREILSKPAGGTYLVCGHSNTVPLIVQNLGVSDAPELEEDEYGDLFAVTIDRSGSTLQRKRFGD